ncbi:MAG: acylneuraminate cytidylyltransferase family protein [Phycisphaerales bacterium]
MSGAIAVILARAGSKGLPGKNVAPVGGRPCIAWTLDDAANATGISRVVVSSDDRRALEIAQALGAEGLERPGELATDGATVEGAVRHAVEALGWSGGPVVILYANVPVRPAGLIGRALDRLGEGFDSVQSYAPVGKHHPWWTAKVDETTGGVRPWEGDVLNHGVHRRQDLPPAYVPDGGVLVVTPEALFGRVAGVAPGPHTFLGATRGGVITREGEVVDIDSRTDQLVADVLLRERVGGTDHHSARGWRRTG